MACHEALHREIDGRLACDCVRCVGCGCQTFRLLELAYYLDELLAPAIAVSTNFRAFAS
jgi:hypothetical protein